MKFVMVLSQFYQNITDYLECKIMANLFSLIQTQQNNNKDSKKVRIGYTASQYKGVFASLEAANRIIKTVTNNSTVAGSFSTSTGLSFGPEYSVVGASNLSIKIQTDTKWTDQYQGRCIVRDYMSYCLEKGGKRGFVSDRFAFSTNSIGADGATLAGAKTCPASTLEQCQTKQNKDYNIGVALDFQRFAKSFIEHFFGTGLEQEDLKKLANAKQLYAEILFPQSGITDETTQIESTFKIIHCPIVLDSPFTPEQFHIISIPNPLIMLYDFKQLATVSVQVVDKTKSQTVNVGQGGVSFPFSSNKYNHKTGVITGFNDSAFNNMASGEVLAFTDSQTNFISDFCFVRLFISKDAESKVSAKMKWNQGAKKEELFKSHYDTNQLIKRDIISLTSTDLMGLYEEFGRTLSPPMSGVDVEKAIDTVAEFESGKNWAKVDDIKDGQGFSCGYLQFTVAAQGHVIFCQKYRQVAAKNGTTLTSQQENFLTTVANTGKITSKSTLSTILGTPQGKVAQIATWNKEKGDITRRCYNALTGGDVNVASPLLLASIIGGSNHIPAHYEDYLRSNNVVNYRNNPSLLIRHVEACHWLSWFHYNQTKKDKKKTYQYIGEIPSSTKFLASNGSYIKMKSNGTSTGFIYYDSDDYSSGQWTRCLTIVKAAIEGKFNIPTPLGRVRKWNGNWLGNEQQNN